MINAGKNISWEQNSAWLGKAELPLGYFWHLMKLG
jgi:hypothetical protein